MRLAVHLALEARVADGAPDVVVGPVQQVRRAGVAVADAPARAEDLRTSALSSPLVSFRNSMCGAAATMTPPLAKTRLVGEVQPIGEDGELVGPAVAVGVLEDLDPVVARLAVQHQVRVIDRLDDPEPAALVEREGDRLDDVRLLRKQLELELGRHLDELHRIGAARTASGTSAPDRASRSSGR